MGAFRELVKSSNKLNNNYREKYSTYGVYRIKKRNVLIVYTVIDRKDADKWASIIWNDNGYLPLVLLKTKRQGRFMLVTVNPRAQVTKKYKTSKKMIVDYYDKNAL